MHHSKAFILLWLLAFPSMLLAQLPGRNKSIIDSAIEANLTSLAKHHPDSAIRYASNLLNRKETAGDEALAHLMSGIAYRQKGNLDSALHFLEAAKQLFIKDNRTDDIIYSIINLSDIYIRKSQLVQATQLLMEADSMLQTHPSSPWEPQVKMWLGVVYKKTDDYDKSLAYHLEAMESFRKKGNLSEYTDAVYSLSIMYRIINQPDSSLALLKRNENTIRTLLNSPYQLAMFHEHLGESYFDLKQYREALDNYKKAYATLEKNHTGEDLAYEAYCVGKAYKALGETEQAEKYLLQAFNMNDSLHIINFQYDISETLSDLYRQSGNWKKAYQYLEVSANLKDEIGLQRQIAQSNDLQEKYESEKKEQQILLLKTQNQLGEAQNRRVRLVQYIFIILFLTAVVIGWLLLTRARDKRKLEQQTLRNRIASDLHDDMGSVLSSIDINSRIALAKSEDPGAVKEYLKKIRHQTQITLDGMSDIVWSINPANDNFESMLSRMREFATEICEPQNIELSFAEPVLPDVQISTADKRKNIFLIFKEAVNNAGKYSEASRLDVSFDGTRKNFLAMSISDNGKGFDPEEVRQGNGLRNMQSRAVQVGGSVVIRSEKGKGTSVRLECPL
ncbi:MAG: hypothetical protein J5I50_03800 [Chitinophagaceae bacterium]|nr:hypothetical protein [Chitinophagaceae bacterium]